VETNTISVVADPSVLVGGKAPAALVAAGAAIKDEYTKTYEAGVKTTLFDRKLRFNANVFYTKIKDFQDTVFTGGPLGFLTYNGPSKSYGAEVDTTLRLSHSLRINASATYANATAVIQPIDDHGNLVVDGSGNPVFQKFRRPQAPKFIYNIGADFNTPITDDLELVLNGSVRHRDSMYNTRQEQNFSKSLTTLDLSAGIQAADGSWGIDLVAKNVTNSVSEDFASPPPDARFSIFYGAHVASPNQLRTISLSGRIKF
jgi:iron complex outermembrane receptor protein